MIRALITILLLVSSANAAQLIITHTGPASVTVASDPAPFESCAALPDYQAWPEYPAGPVYVLPGADFKLLLTPDETDPRIAHVDSVMYTTNEPFTSSYLLSVEVTESLYDGTFSQQWICTAAFDGLTDSGIVQDCEHPDVTHPTWREDFTPVTTTWDATPDSDIPGWKKVWTFTEPAQPYTSSGLISLFTATGTVLPGGVLDIRIPAAQTRDMLNWAGSLYIIMTSADGASSGLTVPISFYPTVTRRP